MIHPQFAENVRGMYSQQDAEECWAHIVHALSEKLKTPVATAGGVKSFIDHYFGLEMLTTTKCNEGDEAPTLSFDTANELKCHITKDVSLLYNGILEGLKGELEKNSPALGRSAIYSKVGEKEKRKKYFNLWTFCVDVQALAPAVVPHCQLCALLLAS